MAEYRPSSDRRDGDENKPSAGVIGGAAAVGATVGAIVSGPFVALALGAGAAGLCLSDNKAGDVARSTGRAGVAAVDKGKDFFQRHRVGERVKDAAETSYQKAREFDERHGIMEKTKSGASKAWTSVREFDRKHQITSRTSEAIVTTMDGATTALSGTDQSDSSKPASGPKK